MDQIIAVLVALGGLAAILQFLESIKVIEWLTFARVLTLVINLAILVALGLLAKRVGDVRGDIDLLNQGRDAHDKRLGQLERRHDEGGKNATP